MADYRSLDPERIIATIDLLERRIAERFPQSGLRSVAADFKGLARVLAREAEELRKPIGWVRPVVTGLAAAGLVVLMLIAARLRFDRIETGAFDFFQGLEASINTLILLGLGLFWVARAGDRIKRRRVFRQLHKLRSLIHVVDMHQLTKDPGILSMNVQPTQSSPERSMTPADLGRYLDYCSEMLSLSGKLAALFAQSVEDSVVVEAVNDLEDLSTNLSRKIWQKIMMVEEIASRAG